MLVHIGPTQLLVVTVGPDYHYVATLSHYVVTFRLHSVISRLVALGQLKCYSNFCFSMFSK